MAIIEARARQGKGKPKAREGKKARKKERKKGKEKRKAYFVNICHL